MIRSRRSCLALSVVLVAVLGILGAPSVLTAENKAESVHSSMEAMGKAWKVLKRQANGSAFDADSMGLVLTLQKHAMAAKDLLPPIISKAPAAEQAKMTIGYKKQMAGLITELLKLEVALLEGDNAAAAESVKALDKLQKAGHGEFMED